MQRRAESPEQESAQYRWLHDTFPDRARPVGFYPLPTTRSDTPFDPDWVGTHTGERTRLLYVHVPFCNQRCHYCRFYPGPNSRGIEERFLAGAVEQLTWWGSALGDQQPVSAAFFGGGSPSALSPGGMSTLFDAIRGAFRIASDAEITMEWYPADCAADKLDTAIGHGVTRFSIGAQSWNPEVLAALGCHHRPEQVDRLLQMLRDRHVDNVNVDLMCNVAGQSLGQHLADVRRAASTGATMISTNILELASGTPYSATGGTESGAAEKRMWLYETSRALRHLGYTNQRMRNFYRDDRYHRYNRFCAGLDFDIIPIGPGAYGYVDGMPVISEPDRTRWQQRAATGAVSGYSRTSNGELRRAFVVNSFLELGLDADTYTQRFGSSPFDDFPLLAELRERRILHAQASSWRLSQPGIEFADDISVRLYSDVQRDLFARHLNIGRSRHESQYFPLPVTRGTTR